MSHSTKRFIERIQGLTASQRKSFDSKVRKQAISLFKCVPESWALRAIVRGEHIATFVGHGARLSTVLTPDMSYSAAAHAVWNIGQ